MAIRLPDNEGSTETLTEIDLTAEAEIDLEDLWEHRQALHHLCQRIVGDAATADDVVQETYLRALRNLDRLEKRPSLMPWLATVARRRSLDEIRRRRYSTPVEFVPEAPVVPEQGPEQRVSDVETVERVREALSALNDRERRLLSLQVDGGMSLTELAEEDGTTVGSVRSVLVRARAKLRATLGDHSFPALVPVAGAAAWARRKLTDLNVRLQQTVGTGPGAERLGELVAAGFVTVAVGGAVLSPAPLHEPEIASDEPPTAISTGSDDAPASLSPASPAATAVSAAGEGVSPAAPAAETDPADAVAASTPVDLLMPPDDVDEPEDAAFGRASASSDGGAVVVAGHRRGDCATGCLVLFRSLDGGASWERLPAEGLGGTDVVVAPGYPRDPRVFASGPAGLTISTDGGFTFEPAATNLGAGPLALPPGFGHGDERVLVGAAPAWEYDVDGDRAQPVVGAPVASPAVHFAFSPDYTRTGRLFAGAATTEDDGVNAAVYRCDRSLPGDTCTRSTVLPGLHDVPEVFVSSTFDRDSTVLAWATGGLMVSSDAASTFRRADVPGDLGVRSVTDDGTGTFYAAAHSPSGSTAGGILRSSDAGRTWHTIPTGTALDAGASTVQVLSGGRLLATPLDAVGGGVFCSADGGRTWTPRCGDAS